MSEPFSFGYWLKRQRLARDLRQAALAHELGIAVITLRKIEADERRPSLQLIEQVAVFFALDAAERQTLLRVARADLNPSALPLPTRAHAVEVGAADSVVVPRHNLPVAPTTLLGRERELTAVGTLLGDDTIRLVTLTGPGGIGKTRLALQAAADALASFPDGAWFVDLAPLHDPDLVLVTVAQTLGVREGGRLLHTQLADYLREKRVLLLLDNCEQVLAAAPQLATLLATAPGVKLLVTSRIILRLAGEHEYVLPPLSLPTPGATLLVEQVNTYDAVRLFIVRARAVRAEFAVTSTNAPVIAAICQRLDGLPLAIELAAARLRLFAPEALHTRLGDHLQSIPLELLVGGPRDSPTRQQTLRATIDWSYNLLAPTEQRLFAYLGAFSGGWDLASAEAVCGIALGADVLAALEALVAQSLVQVRDGPVGEPRFRMLETILAYAVERLEASGASEVIRDAHAAHFLAVVERAEPELRGAQSIDWMQRIEGEHSNLRVALDRLLAQGDCERLARACYALWRFWFNHGTWGEERRWLEATIDDRAAAALDPALRGRALLAMGMTLAMQSEFTRALAYGEESATLLRHAHDHAALSDALECITHAKWGLSDFAGTTAAIAEAVALDRASGDRYRLAWHLELHSFAAFVNSDLAGARARSAESLALFQELGIQDKIAWALTSVATHEKTDGNYARAAELLMESLAISRAAGDRYNIAATLNYMSQVCLAQGQYAQAELLAAESLSIRRELGDRRGAVAIYDLLADAVRAQGEIARAQSYIAEGLRLSREMGGYQQGYSWLLRCAVAQALALAQHERAARLLGAEEALREANAILIWPDESQRYAQYIEATRAGLSEESYAVAWASGRMFSLDQALAEALAAQ